ncbi:MAG: N-acetyl-gamma-glutamyl-phosphate reductase [Rhodobacteraceae bacterium]|nr:N-acetyl-gamma-glutamyl-phosphate reductase [Paracoccaceae bacterium]
MPCAIAILGASGYTGAELVRIILTHPEMRITALSADRKAGMAMGSVFPFLRSAHLPVLQRIEDIDFACVDLVFCALPHATSQSIINALPRNVKVIDLSADFRLRDTAAYRKWYGKPHDAPGLQAHAVYGLTEFYREEIRAARLVAGTGCNAAAGQYAISPLLRAGVIDPDEIIINLMAGVSGAGRALKENLLHAEVSEGTNAYALGGTHRHLGEFDQEFSSIVGRPVQIQFTPYLVPMNRGILASCHVQGQGGALHTALATAYKAEPFVHVLPLGAAPSTHDVRGSNHVHVGVVADRQEGRAQVIVALDNLTKGSSGQAIQNANLMLGIRETAGLGFAPMFP